MAQTPNASISASITWSNGDEAPFSLSANRVMDIVGGRPVLKVQSIATGGTALGITLSGSEGILLLAVRNLDNTNFVKIFHSSSTMKLAPKGGFALIELPGTWGVVPTFYADTAACEIEFLAVVGLSSVVR